MRLTSDTPPDGSVRDWLDHRAKTDTVAFTFSDGATELTWKDLRSEAARVASLLTHKGAAKGESIALLHPNSRDGVICFFAAVYGGFRATMINLAAGPGAIAYALEHSEARFAFVHQHAVETFETVSQGLAIQKLDMNETSASELHPVEAKDHALLMYTSGTTGRPKGVIHTHASLLAGGWTSAIAHQLSEQDRGLCVLPMYHINGLCVTVMGALVSGGSVAVCGKFSASRFWQQAESMKVTWFSVVPTIISHLLHGRTDPSEGVTARLRFGRSASSALSPDVQSSFEKRFAVPIIETMGLTETAAQILSNPLPPLLRKIGSPGVPFGNELEVRSLETGNRIVNGDGEIVVRGPNVMQEYFKNPEATRDAFTSDGWLRSGDLGRQDDDGFLFVTGRLKELIIKGGENIAPREIDEALYSHEDVVEAAAFARPCKDYGERVEAAVAVREGSTLAAGDLIALCREILGDFKSPDRIHILSELPKGPSGKIQRMKISDVTG